MTEDTPHLPQTLYAITKSSGEAVTARLGELHGLAGSSPGSAVSSAPTSTTPACATR